LTFVETSAFTRRISSLGLEEPLRELQVLLLAEPQKPVIWIPEQAAFERCGSGTRVEAKENGAEPVFTTYGSLPFH